MNSLDRKHIQIIEADVESARITINNLEQELIDHICCEVESLMSAGKTFDEAYAIIREQTGINVLQKIQENTLYLIDKNYAIMKTAMKITGNISLAFIAIGTTMKIFHWPGAAPVLMIGFFMLCFIFFPSAIYLNYTYKKEKRNPLLNISIGAGAILFMIGVLFKTMHWPGAALLLLLGWSVVLGIFLPILLFVKLKEATSTKEKGIYVLGAIALTLFELSTMFKFFHWPGAGPLMLLGSFLLIIVFLPMFASLKIKRGEMNTAQFVFLITVSLYAVVLTSLLSMNVSDVILDRFVADESNSAKIIRYYETKNDQLQKNVNNDSLSRQALALKTDANKIKEIILDIKLRMLQMIEGVDKAGAIRFISAPDLIQKKDNYDIVNHVLLGNGNDIRGLAPTLKEELIKFRTTAMEAASSNINLAKGIEKLLDTSDKQVNEEKRNWEEINFRNNMLISTLAQLNDIEKNVRVVEALVIKY